ncbi:response regulator [Aetokthonos hydrillicola Thurmond2011]|uniref:Protein PatA n=1 Tax=Aetokthonos hydrillicola Thurmond2011 TaxID=2712845 RepID=A0AAP5M5R1_9CYAN|nr:response regulator [Aetokthonos hydrillicola]MDR9896196.1 response regulator [Aetokthonos hydrillicola Thurmond2011]
MGHGAWGMGHWAWGIGHGALGMGHGAWGMGHGAWGMGHESWVVFFFNGEIIYAQKVDKNKNLSQISDNLRHHNVNLQIEEIPFAALGLLNLPEYDYLWVLLKKNVIKPSQARRIIHSLVYETVFDLLNLRYGNFIFQQGFALAPHLTTLKIAPTLTKIIKQVQEWKLLYPHIQSADQFPVLADLAELRSSLPAITLNKLQQWTDGKTSLRQLSRYLNRDILTVAKAIYPYIQQGLMELVYLDTDEQDLLLDRDTSQKASIVCIDHQTTSCEAIKSILLSKGYDAIAIHNPLEALGVVFQMKPDLILCNAAMPELDGYEICAMLRQSRAFRLVPIIMLTGEGDLLEEARARMVGATDYLTKPFDETQLLVLVENYLDKTYYPGEKPNTC